MKKLKTNHLTFNGEVILNGELCNYGVTVIYEINKEVVYIKGVSGNLKEYNEKIIIMVDDTFTNNKNIQQEIEEKYKHCLNKQYLWFVYGNILITAQTKEEYIKFSNAFNDDLKANGLNTIKDHKIVEHLYKCFFVAEGNYLSQQDF